MSSEYLRCISCGFVTVSIEFEASEGAGFLVCPGCGNEADEYSGDFEDATGVDEDDL